MAARGLVYRAAVVIGVLFLLVAVGAVALQFAVVAGNRRRARELGPPGGPQVHPAATAPAAPAMRCHHCGGGDFDRREAQLNTAGMTFLNLDWANRSAACFVCRACGFIHWFLPG